MKKLILVVFICSFLIPEVAEAQILDRVKRRAERRVEDKVDKKIGDILNGKKKKKKDQDQNEEERSDESEQLPEQEDSASEKSEEASTKKTGDTKLDLWTNYDFYPADRVIFYDDFRSDEYGDFPSRWNLSRGNGEVARLNGKKVLLIKGENNTLFTPMINNLSFTERTTIEFDIYCGEDFWGSNSPNYHVKLWANAQYYESYKDSNTREKLGDIRIHSNGANISVEMGDYGQKIPKKNLDYEIGWHHISIVVDKKRLQGYFDHHKVLNIPNLGDTATGLSLQGRLTFADDVLAIKNLKVAEGGMSFSRKVTADGGFVTHGILFDTGKASLKAESAGVLKRVTDLLLDHPDWAFDIIGHTDSDGDDANNLKLSLERANQVKEALIARGIAEDRLTTLGKGESEPLNTNSSVEEKANNRRVEFLLKQE